MAGTTIVADFVEVSGGQHFQRGWRDVVVRAIELGQIIAITDLCNDLTGSIVFAMLVNKVHANEVDWLEVVGFGHDCLTLKPQQKEYTTPDDGTLIRRPMSGIFWGLKYVSKLLSKTKRKLPRNALPR